MNDQGPEMVTSLMLQRKFNSSIRGKMPGRGAPSREINQAFSTTGQRFELHWMRAMDLQACDVTELILALSVKQTPVYEFQNHQSDLHRRYS